jgi:hypothetical protein
MRPSLVVPAVVAVVVVGSGVVVIVPSSDLDANVSPRTR